MPSCWVLILKLNFLTGDRNTSLLANKGFNLYAGENSKVNGGLSIPVLFVDR
jgi:protein SCO1/2